MIVSTRSGKLILLQDFEVVRVYEQAGVTFFAQLPGYDKQTYPFVIAAGSDYISLLNTQTNYIEHLVNAQASSLFFIARAESEGFDMHFLTGDAFDTTRIWLGWA